VICSLPTQAADSLLGSLCRELGRVLSRRSQIKAQLQHCRDLDLIRRLEGELEWGAARQAELQAAALGWQGFSGLEPCGLAFLLELTRRPSLA
jgi:hypothetical protein